MRSWMKEARLARNLTMQDVAKELDVSESYYSLIERGIRQKNIDIVLASKLSSIFGVSIQYIVRMETGMSGCD